jgi:hypothetical protein
MAANLMGMTFRAADFDPATGSSQLPVGLHPAIVAESEVIPTRDKDGGMLALTLQIIDGEHKNARGVWRLNLWNKSQQAADIAARQLSALCHVIGVPELTNDVSPVHGKPFLVEVALQSGENGTEKGYTEVRAVKKMDGTAPKRGEFQPVAGGTNQPQGNQPGAGFSGGNNQPQNQGNQGGQWGGGQQGNQGAPQGQNGPQGGQGGGWGQNQGGGAPQGQSGGQQGGTQWGGQGGGNANQGNANQGGGWSQGGNAGGSAGGSGRPWG